MRKIILNTEKCTQGCIFGSMRTFVLGDIHGAARALDQCLERAGFDKKNDILIQLGDVVDRHDEVFECVETLLQIDNLIALKGNHDDYFDRFLHTDVHPGDWTYGGLDTVKSYLRHAGKAGVFHEKGEGYSTNLVASDVPAAHREFFSRQRPYYVDELNRCFVHGGLDPRLPINEQQPEDIYWDRRLWRNAYEHKRSLGEEQYPGHDGILPDFREVYVGHTPTTNWDTDQPLNAFNIWNIDTGAAGLGRLTVMDVDTKEYWQSDLLADLYPDAGRVSA